MIMSYVTKELKKMLHKGMEGKMSKQIKIENIGWNPLQEADSEEEFKEIWFEYVEPWKEKRKSCEYLGDEFSVGRAIQPICELIGSGCSLLNCPRKEEFSENREEILE